MAKTCLGIDIGREQLKLVLMKGETIQKSVSVQMPDGLFRDGRIVSVESTGELIRQTMKEHKIHCRDAAVVIPYAASYLRNVTMPKMTPEQMMYNLPYEFRDYISDELKKYAFDYIQYEKAEEENEILAMAVPLETLEDLRLATRKAGLRLRLAAPEVSACETLLYRYLLKHPDVNAEKEYGILDLGSNSSRLMIFRGYRHQVTRTVEQGMDRVEELLADHYHIDIHLAHAWLLTNHEDCVHSEACQDAFSQISVEIMRALNFYQFSNPGSQLEDIWVCGSSAATESMKERLRENVDVNIRDAVEILEDMQGNGKTDLNSVCFQAVGIGLNHNVTLKNKCINLAMAGVEKKHYALAVPALVVIVAGAGTIGKFAVADRLLEVSRQQSAVSSLQQQVDAANAYIESLGDLQDTYAHYSYQGFTMDEAGYMNRPEVMQLLQDVVFPKVKAGSWSLEGGQLTLPVTGATLEDINQLAQELNAQDLVEYCTVTTAATDNMEGQAEAVTGQITIYLKTILPDDLQQILGGTDNETNES